MERASWSDQKTLYILIRKLLESLKKRKESEWAGKIFEEMLAKILLNLIKL